MMFFPEGVVVEAETLMEVEMPMEGIKLRPGASLMIFPQGRGIGSGIDADFIATLNGRSVFVSVPNLPAGMPRPGQGDVLRVTGFDGQYEFSFDASVQSMEENPFLHLHLDYPARVNGRQVRKELRLTADYNVTLEPEGGAPMQARMRNLSLSGAMVDCGASPGEVGQGVRLRFARRQGSAGDEPGLQAVIRHAAVVEGGEVRAGLEFQSLRAGEKNTLYRIYHALALLER